MPRKLLKPLNLWKISVSKIQADVVADGAVGGGAGRSCAHIWAVPNKEDGARGLTTFVADLPDKLVKPAEVRAKA
jgi:hypothetical protein